MEKNIGDTVKRPRGKVRGMYMLKSKGSRHANTCKKTFPDKGMTCAEVLRQGPIHNTQENKTRTVTQEFGLCICCGR